MGKFRQQVIIPLSDFQFNDPSMSLEKFLFSNDCCLVNTSSKRILYSENDELFVCSNNLQLYDYAFCADLPDKADDKMVYEVIRRLDKLSLSVLLSQKGSFRREHVLVVSEEDSGYKLSDRQGFLTKSYRSGINNPVSYFRNFFHRSHLEQAKKFFPVIDNFYPPNESRVGRALQWMWTAFSAVFPSHRILALWACLESLFGSDKGEITHKISERIAVFLEEKLEDKIALYDFLKKSYGTRSDLIHGKNLAQFVQGKLEENEDLLKLDDIIRRCFFKILHDERLISQFDLDGSKRESWLNHMVFRGVSVCQD